MRNLKIAKRKRIIL